MRADVGDDSNVLLLLPLRLQGCLDVGLPITQEHAADHEAPPRKASERLRSRICSPPTRASQEYLRLRKRLGVLVFLVDGQPIVDESQVPRYTPPYKAVVVHNPLGYWFTEPQKSVYSFILFSGLGSFRFELSPPPRSRFCVRVCAPPHALAAPDPRCCERAVACCYDIASWA